MRCATLLLTLGVLASACRDEPPKNEAAPAPSPATVELPAIAELQAVTLPLPPGSQTPNLGTTPSGELLLTWIEPASDDALALRLARRDANGWSAPTTITTGTLFDNWADFPLAGALPDGTLVATWLQPHEQGEGYGIRWSRSTDAGASWSAPQVLHEDQAGPEYGFVSMAATPDDRLALFWLDGRTATGERAQMQLRTAIVGPQGDPVERGLVDDRVCDCCQTSAAATPGGPVIAYRNRSVEERRDIHVAGPLPRLGEAVHEDGWTIAGCPVNGPSIAAQGERLAIAWFTAADERPAVQVAFGTAGGDFDGPVQVDLGEPVGRVSLVMLDGFTAVVTFVERRGGEGQALVLARRVSARGQLGPAKTIAQTTAANASGFPRSAVVGDRIVWAWTEVEGGTKRVRVAEAPISSVG